MKTWEVSPQEGTAQIINHSIQDMAVAVQGQLPYLPALNKTTRERRVQLEASPPNLASFTDLVTPQDAVQRQYESEPGNPGNFLLAEKDLDAGILMRHSVAPPLFLPKFYLLLRSLEDFI